MKGGGELRGGCYKTEGRVESRKGKRNVDFLDL